MLPAPESFHDEENKSTGVCAVARLRSKRGTSQRKGTGTGGIRRAHGNHASQLPRGDRSAKIDVS